MAGERGTVEVSPLVRERLRQLGTPGQRWLAELPALVAELERDWSVTVGEPLTGGSAGYVARARTADGRPAVVKIIVPDPVLVNQVRTMVEAHGNGYAHVLAHDVTRQAMLMEALGPAMDQSPHPPEQMIELLCRSLRYAWRLPPWPELTVDPDREKARLLHDLVSQLWIELDRPCPAPVVAEALRCAERRAAAFDPERCVVVHGDPHPGNALRVPHPRPGAESGYVFVDPDGFLAEPAYDLGVVLRDWCPQLLAGDPYAVARRYTRLVAGWTGVDETAIWQWSYLERVATGLYLLRLGEREHGRRFLTTAEALVRSDRSDVR